MINPEKDVCSPDQERTREQSLEVLSKSFGHMTVLDIQKLSKDPYMPTPEPIDYESEDSLYGEVVAFLKKHVDFSRPILYDVCACFSLATWRAAQSMYATYLALLGPKAWGKSKTLETMMWTCNKALQCEGVSRGAIIRLTHKANATLMLDESENWLKSQDYDNPVAAALNAGYRRSPMGGIAICEPEKDGKYAIKVYDCFGFKIIAGRNPLNDVLASRCITIQCRKSDRQFPKFNVEEAWILRGKLAKYAEKHAKEELEHEDADKIREARLREVFTPLIASAPNDEVRSRLLEFAEEESSQRDKEEQGSEEAIICRIIIEMHDGKPTESQLPMKEVANKLNDGKPENEWRKVAYVGRIVKRLGLNTEHTREGSMIIMKHDTLEYLRSRYVKDGAKQEGALDKLLQTGQ